MAADDLALLTHRLDRRSYLHDPFRLIIQTGWLWRPVRPPLPCPRSGHAQKPPSRAPSATEQDSKGSRAAAASPADASDARDLRPRYSSGCSPRRARGLSPRSPGRRPRSRRALPAASAVGRRVAARPRARVYGARRRPAVAPVLALLRATRTRTAGSCAPAATRATGSSCSSASRRGRPVEAVYAQHSGARALRLADVRAPRRAARRLSRHTARTRPTSAPGTRDRMWPDPNDEADGRGRVARARPSSPRAAASDPARWAHGLPAPPSVPVGAARPRPRSIPGELVAPPPGARRSSARRPALRAARVGRRRRRPPPGSCRGGLRSRRRP